MVIQHQKNRKNQSINQSINKSDLTEIVKGGIKSEEQKIKTLCESREKGINDFLMIILKLYLKLKTKQSMEKDSKYQLLIKCFKDYQ